MERFHESCRIHGEREVGGRWEEEGRWGRGGEGRWGRKGGERGEGYSHESWSCTRMNYGTFLCGEFHFVTAYGICCDFRSCPLPSNSIVVRRRTTESIVVSVNTTRHGVCATVKETRSPDSSSC